MNAYEQKLDRVLNHIDKMTERDDKLTEAINKNSNETTKLSGEINEMRICIGTVKKDVQKHEDFISGPPAPGAKLDLDRLSQSAKFQKRGLWVVAAAALTSFTKTIIGFLSTTPSSNP
jgi:hypothetical protein